MATTPADNSNTGPSSAMNAGATNFVPTARNDTYPFIRALQGAPFTGRSVVITGASKGIGKALAVAFARAGYSQIALLARSGPGLAATVTQVRAAAADARHKTPTVMAVSTDATSVESVAAAAQQVGEAFGHGVDILVNNAGYLEAWKPVDQSDPDDWWRAWEVNVRGTYLVSRAFLPLVLRSGQKTIVTVSSAGAWFTLTGASAYEGTKTAQIRFTNHLQFEYGDKGLLAYSIHPGAIKTDLSSNMPEQLHGMFQDTLDLPADTLVWLTQERREWLADRYVSVQWDMEEFIARKDEIVAKDLLKLKLSQY